MTQVKRYWVLGVAILVAGAVRLPFERQFTIDLHQEKLLSPKLEIGTGEKLGQTFYAVSLGGLRSLIATFMNLRAFGYFEKQQWADVVDSYDLIVDLAPHQILDRQQLSAIHLAQQHDAGIDRSVDHFPRLGSR